MRNFAGHKVLLILRNPWARVEISTDAGNFTPHDHNLSLYKEHKLRTECLAQVQMCVIVQNGFKGRGVRKGYSCTFRI
jgi:hypothetical protein